MKFCAIKCSKLSAVFDFASKIFQRASRSIRLKSSTISPKNSDDSTNVANFLVGPTCAFNREMMNFVFSLIQFLNLISSCGKISDGNNLEIFRSQVSFSGTWFHIYMYFINTTTICLKVGNINGCQMYKRKCIVY